MLVYYHLIYLPASNKTAALELSPTLFFLLSISTLFIMAGGYVINDIVDWKVDLVNKPMQSLINKSITQFQAKFIYVLLNIFGAISAIAVAIQLNHVNLGMLIISAAMMLYLYSKYLQGVILVGNFLIAILCGLVIYIVKIAGRNDLQGAASDPFLLFAIFAIAVTMWREIVKDLEDRIGDEKHNILTLAQIDNGKYSILLSRGIGLLTIAGISFLLWSNWNDLQSSTQIYGLSLILTALFITRKAFVLQVEDSFRRMSYYQKLFMVQGILSIFFWHG